MKMAREPNAGAEHDRRGALGALGELGFFAIYNGFNHA